MRSRTKMAIAQRAAKKPASKTPVVQAVADYIAGQLEATQVALAQVRSAIRKAIPRAEEVIAYKIPAYKLDGEIVLYFAGWKRHYSLYPAGEHLVEAFQHQLAR
ncbi:MAG: DUF1801 domain-containing protein, partial [Acidobacteriaceae bacterium]|nr:DUF1801 domain-containing protein [Acidobacteriaceae bacterium]